MARIRTIKPEFWSDEKLGPMAPLDRLVFLGLISMADDAGRLLDTPKVIDAFIFPFTDDSASRSVDLLEASGRIRRGVTENGQAVIQIVNWSHQKIDKPNTKAMLPAIDEESTMRRRKVDDVSALHTSTSTSIRTTTDDLLAPAARAKRKASRTVPAGPTDVPDKVTWLTPYIALWESLAGAVEPGMLAKHVGPAHKAIGPQRALQALRRFLENGDARYGSQSFARSFRNWDGESESAGSRKVQRVLDDFLAEGDEVPEAEFTIEGEGQ